MTLLLSLTKVSKEYALGPSKVYAIQGINLEVNESEFVVIIGKSGSGKSTLLSLIGGLEHPSSGSIEFEKSKLELLSEDDLAKLRRDKIGIIFQHFHLMDAMTAMENIELPMLIIGKNRQERVEPALKLLKLVGLTDRASFYPNELSGGERQRVGIARALSNNACLLIADEPTGDLDSEKGKEILEILINLNERKDSPTTIIMVTHDLGMIRKGMRVVVLKVGEIVSDTIQS